MENTKETSNNDKHKALIIPRVIPMLLCNFTEKTWGITKHNKYEMINEDENHYYIINDKGENDKIFKQYFEIVPDNN